MLNSLKSINTRKSKRVGRGIASGKGGHTTGRGTKGQKSRSGYTVPRVGFEGGQNPLSRRLPKLKGFRRAYFKSKVKSVVLTLTDLNGFEDGAVINPQFLLDKGLVSSSSKTVSVKILANGKLDKKVTIENIPVSAAAKSAIEAAGGMV